MSVHLTWNDIGTIAKQVLKNHRCFPHHQPGPKWTENIFIGSYLLIVFISLVPYFFRLEGLLIALDEVDNLHIPIRYREKHDIAVASHY